MILVNGASLHKNSSTKQKKISSRNLTSKNKGRELKFMDETDIKNLLKHSKVNVYVLKNCP